MSEELELPLGRTRAWTDGRILMASPITSSNCAGCVFRGKTPASCIDVWTVMGQCGSPWRIDRKSIVFVDTNEESEDLGEFSF
jgi:hypothetical protein